MEDLTNSAPTAPETSTPVSAPVESKAPERVEETAPPDTRSEREKTEAAEDDALRKAYRESKRERDETGKFAPRDGKPAASSIDDDAKEAKDSAPKADVKGQQPKTELTKQAATEKPATPAIKAPNSWPADMKAKFDTLPPDVRDYVAKRESETHDAISRLGQYASQTKPIVDVLERHRHVFEHNGLTYDQGVERLLAVQNLLDRDPMTAIQQIAKAYKVDLSRFGAHDDGMNIPPDPEVQQMRDHIAHLESQLQQVTGHIQGQQRFAEQQRHQSYLSLIDAFAKDAADFDAVGAEVIANIEVLRQVKPQATPQELLKEAYDRAIWANPETRARHQERFAKEAEERRAAQAREAAEKARAAGRINVTSARGDVTEHASEDDLLRQSYRKAHAR